MHEDLIAALAAAPAGGSPALNEQLWRLIVGPNAQMVTGSIPDFCADPGIGVAETPAPTEADAGESGPAPGGRWRVRLPGQAEASEAATEALARRLAEVRLLAAQGG